MVALLTNMSRSDLNISALVHSKGRQIGKGYHRVACTDRYIITHVTRVQCMLSPAPVALAHLCNTCEGSAEAQWTRYTWPGHSVVGKFVTSVTVIAAAIVCIPRQDKQGAINIRSWWSDQCPLKVKHH